MALSISEILSANDGAVREVECPEWGGSVWVRVLTLSAMLDINEKLEGVSDTKKSLALQLAAYMCDASGRPIVQNDDQAFALLLKSASVVNRIIAAGTALNNAKPGDTNKEK